MRLSYPDGLTSPDMEIAEGGNMLDSKSKFNDLRAMLEENKENIKMEAMKRIINMVAKGKDVSELFPSVVKNVAVKNLELKKLVYVYLVRYAEEQQDLALLSISTFQRALKDPNQLIRASALRVLSSIRVQMIAPVMLLAIKESVRDMSAYVRKVAAHAIPKLYALEPDLHPQLIECIDFLLGDKRTLVLGSAVHAFEQTCPDRLDLLHKHFRSLCRALADVDEWGQVVMIGLLARYARTQFTRPAKQEKQLDPDFSLLLLSAKSLLQSRNCAVVMAVAQLYFYIAPQSYLSHVPRALIRLLRGSNEVQYVVLVNIATICAAKEENDGDELEVNKSMFEPYIKTFFIRSSDTYLNKQLKLHILTSLVTESNVQVVVRELQAYLQMNDLASLAIEAIGRCALSVHSAESSCLSLLVNMVSSHRENIVCAAVVVLKRLLHTDAPESLLKRVIKLIPDIKSSAAKACVVWLVCTHMEKVKMIAPDVLRIIAKNFCDEPDEVKLQALNLAVRLWESDRTRCELLVKYVLQLARYDRSYDIRDRCRFIRNSLFKEGPFQLSCFLNNKPAPLVRSQFVDREHYQLGTLSHLLNQKCAEYNDLPEFPEVAPDPTIRRSTIPLPEELRDNDTDRFGNTESVSDFSGSEEAEDEVEDEEEEEDEEDEAEDDDEVEDSGEEEESEEEEDESEEEEVKIPLKGNNNISKTKAPKPVSDMDLLLDLNFDITTHSSQYNRTSSRPNESVHIILDPAFAYGLSLKSCFDRCLCVHSSSMVNCNWTLEYNSEEDETVNVNITFNEEDSPGVRTSGSITTTISNGEPRTFSVGVDFDDSCRKVVWNVECGSRKFKAELNPSILDLVEAVEMNSEQFEAEKSRLGGLNQVEKALPSGFEPSVTQILKNTPTKQVQGLPLCFASQTVSKKQVILISLQKDSEWNLVVNCENSTFAAIFSQKLFQKLSH